MNKSKNLNNKVAVITGATSQLGRIFAKTLATNGVIVYVTDLDIKLCDELRQQLSNDSKIDHYSCKLDVTSEADVIEVAKKIKLKHGKLDILINSAGTTVFSDFKKRTKEEFMKVCEVNTYGVFNCIQKFSELMISSKSRGSIINIGSIYGTVSGDPRIYTDSKRNTSEVYAATKASIIQMSKYFAVHLGKYNIRVNTISPGGVFNNQGKSFEKNYSNKVPLNRMADESEIEGSILFLSDNKLSSYITGHNLMVDGGFVIW